jgi:hypothetical protein
MSTIDKIVSILNPDFIEHEIGDIVVYAPNFAPRALAVGRIVLHEGELHIEPVSKRKTRDHKAPMLKCSNHRSLPYIRSKDVDDAFCLLPAAVIREMLDIFDPTTSLGANGIHDETLDLFNNPIRSGDVVIFSNGQLQYGQVDYLMEHGAEVMRTDGNVYDDESEFSPFKFLAVFDVSEERKDLLHQYLRDEFNERHNRKDAILLYSSDYKS